MVKLAASGVNFIDVYFREGRYKATVPFVLGQEGAGTITEVGADVKSRESWRACGMDWRAGRLTPNMPQFRLTGWCRFRRAVSEQQAAAVMLQGMTAHYLSHSTYPLKQGETALIHAAAGGVGLLLTQMAHNIGARVIATVSTEEKAKLARGAGAHEVILYTQSDFEADTKRLTGGKGLDVVYDSVGKTTFEKGLNVLRPRGMMVLFGGSSGAVPPFDLISALAKRLALRDPAHACELHRFARRVAGALRRSVRHDRRRENSICESNTPIPLAEAQRAHRDLEGRKTTGKVLLIP